MISASTPTATTAQPSNPSHVLIVADQETTVRTLSARFAAEENFRISSTKDVESGLRKIQTDWPALIILDLAERQQAFDLCRTVRSDRGTMTIPIIIVAGANEVSDRIAGLEAGADDYVGKPFNPREVTLRAKAVMRRRQRVMAEEQFVLGPIRLDPARCRVSIDDHLLRLTAVEFKLLHILIRSPGLVNSRDALVIEARGKGELLESRTIDTHVRRLRQKMGGAAHFIETVRGMGYRLRPV